MIAMITYWLNGAKQERYCAPRVDKINSVVAEIRAMGGTVVAIDVE